MSAGWKVPEIIIRRKIALRPIVVLGLGLGLDDRFLHPWKLSKGMRSCRNIPQRVCLSLSLLNDSVGCSWLRFV
jgi:hypothetical protein